MVRLVTVRDLLGIGCLIEATCPACHRTTHFLPADLAGRVPGELDIQKLPLRCSICDTRQVEITSRPIDQRDMGKLYVMRPVGRKTVTIWKPVKLA